MYRAAEVQPMWKVPTEQDISMAFDVLSLAEEATARINELVDNRSVGDNVWSNDFCRAINVIDKVLRGSYNLILEIDSKKIGGKFGESSVSLEYPVRSYADEKHCA
jgi:proteasome activator subunit 4